jgi:hypothetical protein
LRRVPIPAPASGSVRMRWGGDRTIGRDLCPLAVLCFLPGSGGDAFSSLQPRPPAAALTPLANLLDPCCRVSPGSRMRRGSPPGALPLSSSLFLAGQQGAERRTRKRLLTALACRDLGCRTSRSRSPGLQCRCEHPPARGHRAGRTCNGRGSPAAPAALRTGSSVLRHRRAANLHLRRDLRTDLGPIRSRLRIVRRVQSPSAQKTFLAVRKRILTGQHNRKKFASQYYSVQVSS